MENTFFFPINENRDYDIIPLNPWLEINKKEIQHISTLNFWKEAKNLQWRKDSFLQ